MPKARFSKLFLAVISFAFCGAVTAQCSSLVIGGFDSSRDGYTSLADSSSTSGLRSAIQAQFPGTTFTATNMLTGAYLSTVNDLFISSVTGDTSATSPLTSTEQLALRNFVLGGGTALIFVDNDTYSAGGPAANNSLLAPFGLHVAGTLGGFQAGTVVNTSNPIATGPAGTATSVSTNYPGWFDTLNGALEIADLNGNGQPAVAAFLPGVLGNGSGGVVFFDDSNGIVLDGERTSDDTILILNSLALAPSTSSVPEPGPPGLLGCAAAIGVFYLGMKRGAALKRAALVKTPLGNSWFGDLRS